MAYTDLRINRRRLRNSIEEMAKIGATSEVSLEEANDALHSLNIHTELDIERDKLKSKPV